MRVHVVYDDRGEVLAATVAGEGAEEFVPAEGEHVDEFELPEGVAEDELHLLFEKFSVDVDAKTLKQEARSAGA
jgi:hypothetical protein